MEPDLRAALETAMIALRRGDLESAEQAARQLLDAQPGQPDALHVMGLVARQRKQLPDAIALLRQAAGKAGKNAGVLADLAAMLVEANDVAEAYKVATDAVALDPRMFEGQKRLGEIADALGKMHQAEAAYRAALDLRPNAIGIWDRLGLIYLKQRRTREGIDCLREVIARRPDSAVAHARLGNVFLGIRNLAEAAECFRRATALDPVNAEHHRALGTVLLITGDINAGAAALRTSVTLNPTDTRTMQQLAESVRASEDSEDLARLLATRTRTDLDARQRMFLGFALGKAYDDIGNYADAFVAYAQANASRRSELDYEPADDDRRFSEIRRTFDESFLVRHSGRGIASDAPIFVIGMPRSGTTMVEQLLGAADNVHAAGELDAMASASRFATGVDMTESAVALLRASFDPTQIGESYLARLPPESLRQRRVVDKEPSNFRFAGLIHLAMPNARIVHIRRSPADTCLSIFKVFFSNRSLAYAYDLVEIAHYYNLYRGLMRHWRRVLPGVIYDVSYEELVTAPDVVGPKLFAHCGLEWTDSVLDFHQRSSVVRTASFAQVRRPINTASVNTAARYGDRLVPMLAELARYDEDDGGAR